MRPEKYFTSTEQEREARNREVLSAVRKACIRKEKQDFVEGTDGWLAKNKTEIVKKPGQKDHPRLVRCTPRGRGRGRSVGRGTSGGNQGLSQRSKSCDSPRLSFQGEMFYQTL